MQTIKGPLPFHSKSTNVCMLGNKIKRGQFILTKGHLQFHMQAMLNPNQNEPPATKDCHLDFLYILCPPLRPTSLRKRETAPNCIPMTSVVKGCHHNLPKKGNIPRSHIPPLPSPSHLPPPVQLHILDEGQWKTFLHCDICSSSLFANSLMDLIITKSFISLSFNSALRRNVSQPCLLYNKGVLTCERNIFDIDETIYLLSSSRKVVVRHNNKSGVLRWPVEV